MAIVTDTLIQAEEITNGGILRTGPQNQHLNPDLLAPFIWIAEQTHVVDILGQSLYDDMKTEKAGIISNYNDQCEEPLNDAFPLNACYESFWVFILKRLCSIAVIYEALPSIGIEISNNGLLMPNTQFAESSGIKGIQLLQGTYKRQLTTLRELTTKYICKNSECLPLGCCPTCYYEFENCSCGNCDTAPPKTKLHLFSPRKKY